jgi:hypothetical protein
MKHAPFHPRPRALQQAPVGYVKVKACLTGLFKMIMIYICSVTEPVLSEAGVRRTASF